MAKKQNGFGTVKSFATKAVKPINNKLDRSNAPKAAGVYPSNRRFGTSVQRTIIESYDAESDWIRWRKGYEYYAKAAYESLIQYNPITREYEEAKIRTQLYRSTAFEVDVFFYGWRFSTKNSDSANHYVMKRSVKTFTGEDPELFYVTNKLDRSSSPAIADDEFWVQGDLGREGPILAKSIGDRLTDGKTEATLTYFLNDKQQPALYTGKTLPDSPAQIKILVPTHELESVPYYAENGNNLRAYIGQVAMLPVNNVLRPINEIESIEFTDGSYYFNVTIEDTITDPNNFNQLDDFTILDNRDTVLPPSLYDLEELVPIFSTKNYEGHIQGTFTYQKSDYQRFFGEQYLTADLVKESINSVGYPTLPFIIQDMQTSPQFLDFTVLSAVPFLSTLELYDLPPYPGGKGYLVFADYSFTETMLDTYDGEYRHPINGPYDSVFDQIAADNDFSKLVWYKKINNVDPYIGYKGDFGKIMPVFSDPTKALTLADMYTCSCPSYSQAILRMPQTTQGPEERKVNRQRNYPLPTALSKKDYEGIGTFKSAGVMQAWQNDRAAASFKLCKHTIASMFDEHLKLQEPNTYQTIDAREEFGKKLAADIKEIPKEFYESYARGGINTLEIVFAIAQSLGYDDIETADLVLNADTQFRENEAVEDKASLNYRHGKLL